MRKKFVIGIIVILMFFVSAWYFALFTPYNYFTAKRDIARGKVTFVGFGLVLPSPYEKQIDSLRAEYGVVSREIGCVVTEAEIRGIEIYNKVVIKTLEKRNGRNWHEKFLKELTLIKNKPVN